MFAGFISSLSMMFCVISVSRSKKLEINFVLLDYMICWLESWKNSKGTSENYGNSVFLIKISKLHML